MLLSIREDDWAGRKSCAGEGEVAEAERDDTMASQSRLGLPAWRARATTQLYFYHGRCVVMVVVVVELD